MNTTEFPNGIRVFKPRENAPEFVKANMVITKSELIAWLESQGETVRIDVLQSKKEGGNYYLKINNYKKDDLPF